LGISSIVLQAFLAIASGITVALVTHYLDSKREQRARKARLLGWLEWLHNLVENVEKAETSKREELIRGKLQWWADHMLQAAGDSFNYLSETEIDNLRKLLSKAWLDDVWTFGNKGIVVNLDSRKLTEIKNIAESLIAKLSPNDP